MEKQSKREADQVEDAARRRRLPNTRLDDYFAGSDSDEAIVGAEKQHDKGYPRRAGDGANGDPIQEQGGVLRLGGDPDGCGFLGGQEQGYPCFNCAGGLDFKACQRLRIVYGEDEKKYLSEAKKHVSQLEELLRTEQEETIHDADSSWDVTTLREEVREIYAEMDKGDKK